MDKTGKVLTAIKLDAGVLGVDRRVTDTTKMQAYCLHTKGRRAKIETYLCGAVVERGGKVVGLIEKATDEALAINEGGTVGLRICDGH